MKVADEVWTSVALLHTENPEKTDFSVAEIKARARRENWPIRQGFNVHVSYHCLANKSANPADHRMLHEDSRGRRRLYRLGDPCHSERVQGKVRPDKQDLHPAYQPLVDWYDTVYSKQEPPSPSAAEATPEPIPPRGKGFANPSSIATNESQSVSGTAFVGSAGALVIPDYLCKEMGIKQGTRLAVYRERDRLVLQPVTDEFIRSLRGCAKGETSLVEAREREHRIEKDRLSR